MFWKLSTDRVRPLVRSMGQHDALDGFVTCVSLDATATALRVSKQPSLAAASADFAQMMGRGTLETCDPRGIGGLLFDAARLAQTDGNDELISTLLEAVLLGLREYVEAPDLRAEAHRRLAFRELGLAIGLEALSIFDINRCDATLLAELREYLPLRDEIIAFWRVEDHRRSSTWTEHQDINEVMLATSALPNGFLVFVSPRAPVHEAFPARRVHQYPAPQRRG